VNFRPRPRPEQPPMQMTPMIDVVFNLLFFFVTSQLFAQWETEIPITVPTAQTSRIPQRLPGEIIVNIDTAGQTFVNGRALATADLDALLRKLAGLFPGQPVVLRADKQTDYEHVIRVLDLCRQADIWNISFATAFPENKPATP
jgi:biopolymer transport protein ExbD